MLHYIEIDNTLFVCSLALFSFHQYSLVCFFMIAFFRLFCEIYLD